MKSDEHKHPNIISVYTERYPSSKGIFSTRPRNISEELDESIVVLDTNVLLLPYKVGSKSLDDIRRTYRQLLDAGRLVVPGHVAREFAVNRDDELKTLYLQMSQRANRLKVPEIEIKRYPILESMPEYQHVLQTESEINRGISKLNKKVQKDENEYKKALVAIRNQIKSWNWNDPVSQMYSDLFSENVVVDLTSPQDEVFSELERRAGMDIPPGYRDGDKENKGGNHEGDLMIWLTILEIAEDRKRSTVFVSNDGKNDWWVRSDKERLYPRFELIEEYGRKSGGKSFHILQFPEFLELFGVGQDTVEEVRQAEETGDAVEPAFTGRNWESREAIENSIANWLQSKYPHSWVTSPVRGAVMPFDFIVDHGAGHGSMGVFFKYFSMPSSELFIRNWVLEGAKYWQTTNTFYETPALMLILVGETEEVGLFLMRAARAVPDTPVGVLVVAGYIGMYGRFISLSSSQTISG